jgi:glycerophosphoryl diester phosphodiesterase
MSVACRLRAALMGGAALFAATTAVAEPLTLNGDRPIIIAHRGASGYLPEHTLEAYKLAIQLGADFIEPDLFVSKDNVLVTRHDSTLNSTTNVVSYAATHPSIAALANGSAYPIANFTFAQIQELTATRRNAAGYRNPNAYFDAFGPGYDFNVASLEQVLDLVYETYLNTGRIVGVEPEAKGTGYEQLILDTLNLPKYNSFFDGHLDNVILQSFNQSSVAYWNANSDITAVHLRSCPAALDLATVAAYADGIGISVGTRSSENPTGTPNPANLASCVERAHAAGLIVQAYTFLDVPIDYQTYLQTGVDGIFSNFADVGVRERDALFPVAEPASVALLAFGLIPLLARRMRAAA